MKFLAILLSFLFTFTSNVWETDFVKAKQRASQEHKLILLKFSGSDWCIPCIRMQKEVFESDAFIAYADTALVLVNADFPRLKKNKLPDAQKKSNEKLADVYNKKGEFPLTLLLSEDGKVLHSWSGYPDVGVAEFVTEIKKINNAR